MTVEHLEVLVEEASMEALLQAVLPKLLGHNSFGIYAHQGKSDLMSKLGARLRGYAKWLTPSMRILVVVDRDADDCRKLKKTMDAAAKAAGLVTKGAHKNWQVVNRIAVEEMEAWYFGDWEAVQQAYPDVSANVPKAAGYRDPDAIKGGTWEAFERVMQRAGYFEGGLRKVEAARAIGAFMQPARNGSRSFQALRNALLQQGAP